MPRAGNYSGRPWLAAAPRGPHEAPSVVPLSTKAVKATTTDDGDDEFACPQCDKEFKSKRGAAMHLRSVHES